MPTGTSRRLAAGSRSPTLRNASASSKRSPPASTSRFLSFARRSPRARNREARRPFPPGLFSLSAELLADPDEETAALPPLRGADTDALATADLVHVVEQVEDVGADRHALECARAHEVLRNAGVEHPIGRQRAAIGHDAVRVVCPQARGVDEIDSRH